MVFVLGFCDTVESLRKKTQSTGKESNSGTAEENLHAESIPNMELCTDGEIEKESINVSPPTTQMLRLVKIVV